MVDGVAPLPDFELHRTEHGYTFKFEFEATPEGIGQALHVMLLRLKGPEREKARRMIARRMQHPEMGAQPQSTPEKYIHPATNYRSYANEVDSMCATCGNPRRSHDIDGQRVDCDGYVQFK